MKVKELEGKKRTLKEIFRHKSMTAEIEIWKQKSVPSPPLSLSVALALPRLPLMSAALESKL
jgi:hypothetical protein